MHSYLQNFCFVGLLTQSDDMSNSTLIPTRKQTNATNLDGKIIKSLKKQEEKRDKRAARKKEVNTHFWIHLLSLSTSLFTIFQWQELVARKPKEGEEDPILVEEIRKARENVGMYTRKTSLEYEETDLIRFESHKSHLVLLLTQVRKCQLGYF